MFSYVLNLSVLWTEMSLPQCSDLSLCLTSTSCWSEGVFHYIQTKTGVYKTIQLGGQKKKQSGK